MTELPEIRRRSGASRASLAAGVLALGIAVPLGIGGLIASKTIAQPETVATTKTVTPHPSPHRAPHGNGEPRRHAAHPHAPVHPRSPR